MRVGHRSEPIAASSATTWLRGVDRFMVPSTTMGLVSNACGMPVRYRQARPPPLPLLTPTDVHPSALWMHLAPRRARSGETCRKSASGWPEREVLASQQSSEAARLRC